MRKGCARGLLSGDPAATKPHTGIQMFIVRVTGRLSDRPMKIVAKAYARPLPAWPGVGLAGTGST